MPHLFRGTASRSDAGFTLIEQLVVIAIIATTLAAIGNLIGASSRGASQIERRVSLLQATNNLFLSAASSRDGLNYPKLDGADWDHRWHLTLTPVEEFGLILPENDRWMPMRVSLTACLFSSPGTKRVDPIFANTLASAKIDPNMAADGRNPIIINVLA